MKIRRILLALANKEVSVQYEAGKLKFYGDMSSVSADQRAEIVSLKQEIIDYLQKHSNNIITIPRRNKELEVTSFSQNRLWVIDKLQGGSPEYNMPMAYYVSGKIDLSLLSNVFDTIISRHEILRTVYIENDDITLQCIRSMEEIEFNIAEFDISDLGDEQQTSQVRHLVELSSNAIFDLKKDLMLRVSYIRQSKAKGILLFNMHHIASDGWSMEVLTKEFFALYDAYSQGEISPLPVLDIQYADYAHWQREYLEGEVLESQLSYWEKQLDELPALHSLPLDHVRPTMKQHEGAIVTGELPATTAKQLLAVAKAHKLTPFMLLHGALSLLLSRHSNSADIVIGTPVANRLQAELEPLIGFFVNTLVLRADTNHDTLSDYFAHIRQVHLDAQSNQDVPFEQLVERLKAPRSTAHSPLFQIMMTTNTDYGLNDGSDITSFTLPGVDIQPYQSELVQAKFDIEVDLSISEQGVGLHWTFDVSLFTEQHIEQLNGHFERVLSGIAEDPDVSIAKVPMLSTDEVSFLVDKINVKNDMPTVDIQIHELFEAKAKRYPYNIALSFEKQRMTYKGLNEAANRLANRLRNQGVTGESLVAIFVERSVEMIIGVLAVLKAGGAYVPLDPNYPQARLQFMLENSGVNHLLSQSALINKLALPDELIVFEFDNAEHQLAVTACSASNPLRLSEQKQENLAYVIYTSGSTGQPKGVMVEHKSLVRHICATIKVFDFCSDDRVLQLASFSFDTFVEQTFASLSVGATLHIAASSQLGPGDFFRMVAENEITVTDLSSAFFAQLVTSSLAEQWQQSSISRIAIGGEAVSRTSIRDWHAYGNAQNCRVFNAYGPTEAVITSSIHTIKKEDGNTIRIGRAIGGRRLYVMDPNGVICPFGTTGELYIGDCLARGYLNRPDLTDEVFVKDPFSDNPRSRLYRTGDLVRYLSDENLVFVGRVDDQVKIRGFRIELAEIEHNLAQQANISSSTVMVREDVPGQKRLVAYVIKNSMTEVDDEQLVNDLRTEMMLNLPDYMVPSVFVIIDEWPLTPNGKIDKKGLPAPDASMLVGNYIAPRCVVESTLIDLQAEMFKLDAKTISVTDNFFELGGHSLLAIKYITEINRSLAVDLEIKNIFSHPSTEELAAHIHKYNDGFAIQSSNLSALLPQDDTLATLYCIPGAGALILAFKDLILASQRFINIKCFEHKGLFGNDSPHTSINEIVEDYLKELLLDQPEGPYLIAGHSFGGIIGYEMVVALNSKGHQARLIAIDSYLFPEQKNIVTEENGQASDLTNYSEKELIADIKERFYKENKQKNGGSAKDRMHLSMINENKGMSYLVNKVKEVYQLQTTMMQDYLPAHTLDQDILFLYASESVEPMSRQLEVVAQLTTAKVQVDMMEGDHHSILKISASKICDRIQHFIQN